MSESKALLKSTLIYSIGNFGSRIFSFLLVPLYSFYLTKAELGYYDLIITTVTLVAPFITLQMSDAAYRWLLEAKGDRTKQAKAISGSFSLILVNIILFLLLVFTLMKFFINIQYAFFFIILSCTSVVTVSYTHLGRKKNKRQAFANNL